MATNGEILLWLLRRVSRAAGNNLVHIATTPIHTLQEFGEWVTANRLTCFLIGSGALVIAVPPLIGFSAAGPVAGSIAAGWQAAIGNVVAGSLFATLQSLTMTGILSAIGGWTIAGGIARFLSTSNWRLIPAREFQSVLDVGRQSLVNDLRRILSKLKGHTRTRPFDERTGLLVHLHNNPRISVLIDDLSDIAYDLSAIASGFEALIPASDLRSSSPPADTGPQQGGLDVFRSADISATLVWGEWTQLIALGLTLCSELNVALNAELARGQYDSEPEITRLLGELAVTWTNLSHMPPPNPGGQA